MPIAGEYYKRWCETYDEFADVAAIVGELGLRGYLGFSYRAGINVVHEDGRRDVAGHGPYLGRRQAQSPAGDDSGDGGDGGRRNVSTRAERRAGGA